MKPPYKKLLSILTLITIILILVLYSKSKIQSLHEIQITNWSLSILIIPLYLIFLINNGLIIKLFLIPFKIKLIPKEWFGLSCISSFTNYILPAIGGPTSRAVYLKNKYNFYYSKFIGNLYGNYVLIFLINSSVAIISLGLLKKFYGNWSRPILLIYGAIFLICLFLTVFSINPKIIKFSEKIKRVLIGWEEVRKNKKLISKIILIGIINILASTFMYLIEFKMFGLNINFLTAVIISVTSMLAILINLTPGSLGIKEALVTFISVTLGIDPGIALGVSILDRIVQMLVLFTLGPIFSYILLKHKPKKTENEKHPKK